MMLFLTLCFLHWKSIWQEMIYPPHHLSHTISCRGKVSKHRIYHLTTSWLTATVAVTSHLIAAAALWHLMFLCLSHTLHFFFSRWAMIQHCVIRHFIQDGGQFLYWYLCKRKKKKQLGLATAPHHNENNRRYWSGWVDSFIPIVFLILHLAWSHWGMLGVSLEAVPLCFNSAYDNWLLQPPPRCCLLKTHYESGVSSWLPLSNCCLRWNKMCSLPLTLALVL